MDVDSSVGVGWTKFGSGSVSRESKMFLDENIIERFQWTRVGPVFEVAWSDKV